MVITPAKIKAKTKTKNIQGNSKVMVKGKNVLQNRKQFDTSTV